MASLIPFWYKSFSHFDFQISLFDNSYLWMWLYSTLLLALLYPELNQLFSHLFVPSRWLVSMRPPNGQKQPQILGKNNQPQKMLPNLIINSLFCKLFSKTKNASQMTYIMIKFTNVAINLFMTFMPIKVRLELLCLICVSHFANCIANFTPIPIFHPDNDVNTFLFRSIPQSVT